jgi:hypothetical protein
LDVGWDLELFQQPFSSRRVPSIWTSSAGVDEILKKRLVTPTDT